MMFKDISTFFLSIMIILIFSIATFYIFSGRVTATDSTMLIFIGTAYGLVAQQAGQVVGYWFGTTKGSSDKNSAVSDAISKLPVASSTKTVEATVTTTPTAKETT